jgi:hypothetical protein
MIMETERIERLLTALLIEQIGDGQLTRKILALSRAGLTNLEIATAVGSSSGSVAQILYTDRQSQDKSSKGGKKKPRKAGKEKPR